MKPKRTPRMAWRRRRMSFESLEDRRLMAVASGFMHDHEEIAFPGVIPAGAVEGPNGNFDVRTNVGQATTLFDQGRGMSPSSTASPAEIATTFVRNKASQFGFFPQDAQEIRVTAESTSTLSDLTHVYLQQVYQGIDVFGGVANVSLDAAGQVFWAAANFAPNLASSINTTSPTLTAEQAISAGAQNLGVSVSQPVSAIQRDGDADQSALFTSGGVSRDEIPVKLEILPMAPGQARLVWNLVINMRSTPDCYEINVDAVTGQVLGRYNWTSYDSYRVFPLPLQHPLDGPGLPASHSIVSNPAHPIASPFGWHDTNGVAGPEFTDTRGNNVNAQEDRDGNDTGGARPSGGVGNNYDFPFDPAQSPQANVNQATVNLFYWNNIVHDVMALNGFDEAAGNFQTTNYSGQGLGSDEVEADAQDNATGGDVNNANFLTPPDGPGPIEPRMQMYEFDLSNPRRDSDNAAEIIVHEYGHGISIRLVGGPADVTSLNGIQSGGMGEGWSDFFGLVFTAKDTDVIGDAYPTGTYVLNQPNNGPGVRNFPYSTDLAINPLTYGDIATLNVPHGVGEVWASALWDMYWNLVERYGFDDDLYSGNGGNNLALRLVTEAMKLTPASPTMLQARDAILAADVAMNRGRNSNEIWRAFAKRGMGFTADDGGDHNSTTVMEAFDRPPPVISGVKFADFDGDGVFEPGDLEEGIAGFTIYLDTNNNARLDPGEPSTVTDASGSYVFPMITPGVYIVREIQQPFYTQTAPAGGFHRVVITANGDQALGIDFGNQPEPGEIRGVKFLDENGNGVRDFGEPGQAGVTIQLFDQDDNLRFETVTGPDGAYRFENLPPIVYIVDEVVPTNQTKTFPGPLAGGVHRIDLQPAQTRIDINFGNFGTRGAIAGRKFDDPNGNGVQDETELGVPGVLIYVDANQDGVFNLGEPAQITDQFGRYQIPNLVPGFYDVRERLVDGATQTNPPNNGALLDVQVVSGETTFNVDFYNREFRDYGDAPDAYGTTKARNGASHGIRPGFFLGALVDNEPDGQPNLAALGDDNAGGDFGPGDPIPADGVTTPVSALAADLDNRLGPDLIVVNRVSSVDPTRGSVAVLLNSGSGGLSEAVEYLVGTDPSRVAVGDFDGVNGPDLVISNTGSDDVTILFNRGDGTFDSANAETVDAGPAPRGIAVGDFDRRNGVDIAVANFDVAATVTILLNNGAGEFDDELTVDVNEGPVVDLAVGDMDRDNDLDLVTANSDATVSVVRNLGLVGNVLAFAAPWNFFLNDVPEQIILADLNNDLRLDVATANPNDQTVSVLLNRGNGTLFPNRDTSVGGPATSLAAADLDNDGDRDLVVANGSAGGAAVLINDGRGEFTRGDDVTGATGVGPSTIVVAADFTRDGGDDVILISPEEGAILPALVSLVTEGDDEDGVQFSPQTLIAGRAAVVSITASAPGILSAWIDFNQDEDFSDPNEQIIADLPIAAGETRRTIVVPNTALTGATYARFRFSDQTGLGPTGPAAAGEVEDYLIGIGAVGGDTPSSFQNPANPLDINDDGMLTMFDLQLLVSDLVENGIRMLPEPPTPTVQPPPFLDPSGDGRVNLNDVLLVINGLLVQMQLLGEPEGEAPVAPASVVSDSDASTSDASSDLLFIAPPRLQSTDAEAESRDSANSAPGEAALVGEAESSAPGVVHSEHRDESSRFALSETDDDWDETLEAIAGDVCRATDATIGR